MSAAAFIEARDFLLAHRADYERAYRDFRWPVLDRFNWALDYFDPMARGNQRPALWIVDDGGGEAKLSFAELAERSNRVANWLRGLGVRRGDRLLLMLGNVRAAVGMHAGGDETGRGHHSGDDAAEPRRSRDRFARGRVRHVVAGADNAGEIRRPAGRLHPDRGRRRRARLAALRGRPTTRRPRSRPTARPGPTIRCCSISPRAPRRSPSSSCTATRAIRSAICRRCTGSALQPGDVHLNISSPGWAKHAYSCFFAPWNAGATVFMLNQPRFDAQAAARLLIARCEVTTFCAPPTVWRMLIQEDLARLDAERAGGRRRRRAAQSRNHRAGRARLGPDRPRRLRPDRDDVADRQFRRATGRARRDGPAGAGLSRAARSTTTAPSRRRPRSASRSTRRRSG